MRKLAFLLLPVFLLAGCGDVKPPVYANSGQDVSINTTRYIQPVVQKAGVAVNQATVIQGQVATAGSFQGNPAQFATDIAQAKQSITLAKSEVSAMTYPVAMANQKGETLDALTNLSVDLDKLSSAVSTNKAIAIQSAIEACMADVSSIQSTVQVSQGHM